MRRSALVLWLQRPLFRPIVAAIFVAWLIARMRGSDVNQAAGSRTAALVDVLARRGLSTTEADVVWETGPSGVRGAFVGGARAVVRAHKGSDPSDIYLVSARLSPEGALLAVGNVYDLTRTSSIDEDRPLLHGEEIAYATSAGDIHTAVHVVDLRGWGSSAYDGFTRVQRWQAALTNLQLTGQTAGVVHNVFSLDPVATDVALRFEDSGLLDVTADGRRIVLDGEKPAAVEGSGWVRVSPGERAVPGNLVTWSVDRVRGMEWMGEERMQVVKAVAFTALEWALRARNRVFGPGDSAAQVAAEMGTLGHAGTPTFTDPDIGWPPAPIAPMLHPAIAGEGKWISLDDDPFITPQPGVPGAFVTTFLRPDRDQQTTRVYITMWDPRQIALHMEAGTVEPLSATGEAGPGCIPRKPEVMREVVGGFNGGFQAMHGEYGMQANGVLYLPPKPYAATVMELRDGATAFGSWPGTTDVPPDILSYRQNLTALVEHGTFNPWRRTWWGGTPPGWQDTIHTTRSGICMTKDHFVGYFFGNELSAQALAAAMIRARCEYGMHLDMNPGLVGFEFYDVETSDTWKPLGRPLQSDWEHESTISHLPGFHYRARRMIRGMSEQNFPEYMHLNGRDFFYLTRRPELPGRDVTPLVTPAQPGEGAWRTKGLPQHGFPYALAITTVRPSLARADAAMRVVRIDPRTVLPAGSEGTTESTPTIAVFTGARALLQPGPAVWLSGSRFALAGGPPSPHALALARTRPIGAGPPPRAAVGIDDQDGMLAWVELPPNATPDASTRAAMGALLDALHCTARAAVDGDARALLGGTLDAAGNPVVPPEGLVARLVRGSTPAARLFFDTPPVGPGVWQPLQMQRVRYFSHPKPKDAGAPEGGAETGSGTGSGSGSRSLGTGATP